MAAAALIVLMGRSSLADHYVVPSGSMLPSIEEGDRVLVDKQAFGLRLPMTEVYLTENASPRPGAVVVLVSPESGIVLIKRVIAGPGDTVEIEDGQVLLNGRAAAIIESEEGMVEALGATLHPISFDRGGGPDFGPVTLGPDLFLVMGDNRGDSHDGRSFGLVPRQSIIGRAVAVFSRQGSWTWIPL